MNKQQEKFVNNGYRFADTSDELNLKSTPLPETEKWWWEENGVSFNSERGSGFGSGSSFGSGTSFGFGLFSEVGDGIARTGSLVGSFLLSGPVVGYSIVTTVVNVFGLAKEIPFILDFSQVPSYFTALLSISKPILTEVLVTGKTLLEFTLFGIGFVAVVVAGSLLVYELGKKVVETVKEKHEMKINIRARE